MDMTAIQRVPITFEQYLADASIEGHTEWVDGMVLPMHAVSDEHDLIVQWLSDLLSPLVRRRKLGRVLGEPFVMHLPTVDVGRSPDLMFVSTANLGRIRANHLEGPADLVIEVISPTSRVRDAVHKFAEYEAAGVPEFWLIDPSERTATFFVHDDGERFAGATPVQGLYRSRALPVAMIDPRWLWQRPLPDPLDILADWHVI